MGADGRRAVVVAEGADRHRLSAMMPFFSIRSAAHRRPRDGKRGRVCRAAGLFLAVLLFLTGCATARPSAPPKIPQVQDPAPAVQTRLLQEAQAHHEQGHYDAATRSLQRLIKSYPGSPLLPQAHWWLARSYEQAGALADALAEYRLVGQTTQEAELVRRAKERIAELELVLRGQPAGQLLPGPANGQVAVLVPSGLVPSEPQLDDWVKGLAEAGVTALVVETEDLGRGNGGVTFRTNWAPVARDVVGQVVPAAHRHGLAAWASVALRRIGRVGDRAARSDWADWIYDPASGRLLPSELLDLFHPAYQEYLTGLLADLTAAGIDGVLFTAWAPGAAEGLSQFARKGFERDFGIALDEGSLRLLMSGGPGGRRQEVLPDYWRWTGWKARATLQVVERLMRAVRTRTPAVRFAIRVRQETVTDPVAALVDYGEDLLEAKRLRFDAYLVGPASPGSGAAEPSPGDLVQRTVALIGEAQRIWVARTLPESEPDRVGDRIRQLAGSAPSANGTGRLYVLSARTVP